MQIKKSKYRSFIMMILGSIAFVCIVSSCKVSYGFSDKTSIPDSVKTVRIQYIENRAPYVNPQLSPNLTERLKQKIINQTKLTNTNSDNAHWDISGQIVDYSFSTTGVTSNNGQAQASINRLNVRVHIVINKQISGKTEEYDVSRAFDYKSELSQQTAEAALLDEMLRSLTDEIFNKLFSNW